MLSSASSTRRMGMARNHWTKQSLGLCVCVSSGRESPGALPVDVSDCFRFPVSSKGIALYPRWSNDSFVDSETWRPELDLLSRLTASSSPLRRGSRCSTASSAAGPSLQRSPRTRVPRR